jgi:hypothetical protein
MSRFTNFVLRYSVRRLFLSVAVVGIALAWVADQRRRSSNDLQVAKEFWSNNCSVWFEGQKCASRISQWRYCICGRRVIRASIQVDADSFPISRLAELDALESISITGAAARLDEAAIDLTPLLRLRRLAEVSVRGVRVQVEQIDRLSHIPCFELHETNLSRAEEENLSRSFGSPRTKCGAHYLTYLKQMGLTSPEQSTHPRKP